MNTSYQILFVFIFSLIVYACQSSPKETNMSLSGGTDKVHAETLGTESENQNNQNQEGIKYFETIDPSTGLIMEKYPFPANWKKSQQPGFLYEGPERIRISGAHSVYFDFTDNPDVLMNWRYQGIKNVPPMSLDQIIEQFFMPTARQTGRTLTTTYPLPELAKTRLLYNTQRFTSEPTQWDVQAYSLEWKDKKGMAYITALVIHIGYSQVSSGWYFMNQYLEVPEEHFNKAKKAFLYGLTNVITNPEWVMASNQRDARHAGIQLQAHLGRMAAINARTSASKSIGDIYSEISDISHAGYLNRSDINTRGHSRTVDMIGEHTLIGNHNTGEQYYVPSGNNYYWVNKEGTFIGTDNSLFDPRTDQRLSQMDGERFQKEN